MRENAGVLVEHDVMLAISIDGPPGQHDRLRTDARGRGTCGKILENMRRMRDDYPEYWKAKVTSVSVYDWGTDLEETEAEALQHQAGDEAVEVAVGGRGRDEREARGCQQHAAGRDAGHDAGAELERLGRRGDDWIENPEAAELAGGVGRQCDRRADFREFVRLLIDVG